jgi:ubiquitin-conjugating enzyme E2 G1
MMGIDVHGFGPTMLRDVVEPCASTHTMTPPGLLTDICYRARTELNKNTDSGFSAGLVDESNPFEWQVILTGPPDTI